MQQGYSQGPALPANPAVQSAADPYNASEVSPFSHYSPYMEVVGENSKYILGIDCCEKYSSRTEIVSCGSLSFESNFIVGVIENCFTDMCEAAALNVQWKIERRSDP